MHHFYKKIVWIKDKHTLIKTRMWDLLVQQNIGYFGMRIQIQYGLQFIPAFKLITNIHSTFVPFRCYRGSISFSRRIGWTSLSFSVRFAVFRHVCFNLPRWACAKSFPKEFKLRVIWIEAGSNRIFVILHKNSRKCNFTCLVYL